jgi:hypothetical protein
MTEKQLQGAVVELAKRLGYLVYHTFDSRGRTRAGRTSCCASRHG